MKGRALVEARQASAQLAMTSFRPKIGYAQPVIILFGNELVFNSDLTEEI